MITSTDLITEKPPTNEKQALTLANKNAARPLIVEWVGRGFTRYEMRKELRSKFDLSMNTIDRLIEHTIHEMVISSSEEDDYDLKMTIAIARLSQIFKQAMDKGDLKSALSANDQICRLQGLHLGNETDRPVGNRGKSPTVSSRASKANELSDADLRKQLPDDVIDAEFVHTGVATLDEVDRLLEAEAGR